MLYNVYREETCARARRYYDIYILFFISYRAHEYFYYDIVRIKSTTADVVYAIHVVVWVNG